MTGYADLYKLPEDERIDVIGRFIMSEPQSSARKPMIYALCVEDHAKADRYMKKLGANFPGIREIDRADGLVPGTVTVRIGGPLR